MSDPGERSIVGKMTTIVPPDVPFLERSGCLFAGAGAGKTTTSLALHQSAVSAGKCVIMITFTNATMYDYIRRAEEQGTRIDPSASVFTFHKLAGKILSNAAVSEHINASLETIVPLAIEHTRDRGLQEDLQAVDVILVDESQDSSSENYELVKEIAAVAGATVVMIGDANQCLYRFRNAKPDHLLNHANLHDGFVHILGTNYRSTPQIVALSAAFMRHPISIRAAPSSREGPLPRLVVAPQSEAIDTAISTASNASGTIMLIGRSKHPRFEKGHLVRLGLQTMVNEMSRKAVPYKRLFKETSDDEPLAGGQVMDSSKVNVMTIHGSKGLEADTVVLIDAVEEMVDAAVSPDQLELMYVAVSRAKRELVIINLDTARCDRYLHQAVQQGLCSRQGRPESSSATPVQRNLPQRQTVTQLLTDRTVLSETNLLSLSRLVIVECKQLCRPVSGVSDGVNDLPESNDLRAFYGQLAENCLHMAYISEQSIADVPVVIMRLQDFVSSRLIVPKELESALNRLYVLTGAQRGDSIAREEVRRTLDRLKQSRLPCSGMVRLLSYVDGEMASRDMSRAVLLATSCTQTVCIPELMRLLRRFRRAKTNHERLPFLFRATLFFFQLRQHAGYRWERNYDEHIKAFAPYMHRIALMSRCLPPGCQFEKEFLFGNLRLCGRIDISTASRVVEAKFTSSLTLMHFLQPSLYSFLDGLQFPKQAEAWNLATGERVSVKYRDDSESRWKVLMFLAEVLDKKVQMNDLEISASEEEGYVTLMCGSLRAKQTIERANLDRTMHMIEAKSGFATEA